MMNVNVRRVLAAGAAGVLAVGLLAMSGQAWAEISPSQPWTVTDLSGATPGTAPTGVAAPRRRAASRFGVRHRPGCAVPVQAGDGRVWLVRPGDTLSLVAGCVRVPVPVLAALNGLPDPDLILAGSRLVIPAGMP
jgi:LysM domain